MMGKILQNKWGAQLFPVILTAMVLLQRLFSDIAAAISTLGTHLFSF